MPCPRDSKIPKSFQSARGGCGVATASTATICVQRTLGLAHWGGEGQKRRPEKSAGWLARTFSHIEVAPIVTPESGRPVNPLTGLDSNQSHAFPVSARPLGLGRTTLKTPALGRTDLRVLKYFPFGTVRRLDIVAEFFNLFNGESVSEINSVFGSGLAPIPEFKQPIAGAGARQIQFSLDFEW